MQNSPTQRSHWGMAGQRALQTHFSIATCEQRVSDQYALAAPETDHYRGSRKDMLIVIPARNEAATIGTLLSALRAKGWHTIVVIKDQSPDDPGVIAQAAVHRCSTRHCPWVLGVECRQAFAMRSGMDTKPSSPWTPTASTKWMKSRRCSRPAIKPTLLSAPSPNGQAACASLRGGGFRNWQALICAT